jgi:uncharacterized protein
MPAACCRHGQDRKWAPRHRAAPFCNRLVVMARLPVAGRAKTRLARAIGVAQAARFARQSLAALVGRIGSDPRWQTALAVAPDGAAACRAWPPGIVRVRQGGGDLGDRMQRLIDRTPGGPLVIVGSDIPALGRTHIAAAFRLLGRHDAVFGPASDGGFWLVGLRRRPHRLRPFGGVRWSSPHALADTLANLRGRSVGFLPPLSDVDSARDLQRQGLYVGRRILPAGL